MDAVSDAEVATVVVMSSAQVGKTELLLNVIGYHADQDPAPILVMQPTVDMAEAFSKDRLAPMLRDTPALAGTVKDPRSRDSGNTLLHKSFVGGHVTMVGANAPSALASRPIRVVLADEVDRYPPSAGTEGDPLSLARKRATTFWNRKVLVTSTPTLKGASRIEAEWEISDRRRFWVPCPDCGEAQVLRWAQVRWPDGRPDQAAYACEHCGALWDDPLRWRAIKGGEWRAEAEFRGIAGFHVNEIYSPWVRLADMAQGFLDAKRSPETLKTWVNTSLGESWEEDGERADSHRLEARAEVWEAAPAGVLLVTGGVDVQADRLEVELVGWGVDEESWSLRHAVLYGDPSGPDLWQELDALLQERVETEDGRSLPIQAACIDSGGHHTQQVYRFVGGKARRRIWAIKGMAGAGRPVWPKRASRNNKGRIDLFIVGVDSAKDAVYARLKIPTPGPGYCHVPRGRDHEWFEQLTAEKVVTKYQRGFPVRTYVKRDGQRNEALDCRVYAYAALQSLNVKWGRLLASVERAAAPGPEPPPKQAPIPDPPPGPYDRAAPPAPQQTQPPPRAGVSRSGRRVIRSSFMMR